MSRNSLNTIKATRPNKNVFDMSYDHKLSLNMGELIPIHVQEMIPGDKIMMSSEQMLRMAPMVAPVMHKVDVYVHHFFVPNRILWKRWSEFITGGATGDQTPAFPTITDFGAATTVESGDLADYLGLPLGEIGEPVSALPFAAYQRIWFDYYRDQNLQGSYDEFDDYLILGEGQQSSGNVEKLLPKHLRSWQHDYFTAALPFAQKGDAINIPITVPGQSADIRTKPDGGPFSPTGYFMESDQQGVVAVDGQVRIAGNLGQLLDENDKILTYEPNGTLQADVIGSTVQGTINDLRTAYSLQRWLEKNARGGSRLKEVIYNHFGVVSSDKRLQRAEYIGGSKAPMVISEVLQTSETDETPQANMSGHGVSVAGGRDCAYFCEEHGYVISIMSVMPKPAYQQGIPRHFSKFDRLNYFWPDFAQLGEQEILNKELYYDFAAGNNDETFGYLPRYEEYRHNLPRVSGDFRTSLNFWHMGRIFDDRPLLNEEFILCDPTERIFAVTDPDIHHIYAHVFHKIKCVRSIPKFGTPGWF